MNNLDMLFEIGIWTQTSQDSNSVLLGEARQLQSYQVK